MLIYTGLSLRPGWLPQATASTASPRLGTQAMLSGPWGDFWGCPVQGQELDLVILVDPFQLRIVYDSTK